MCKSDGMIFDKRFIKSFKLLDPSTERFEIINNI